MTTAFRIHAADNVATLLADGEGAVEVRGEGAGGVTLLEPVALGHKVALADIAKGEAVVKYGIPIGFASRPIRLGEWVHLHNLTSDFDERSGGFDLATGASKDMAYD